MRVYENTDDDERRFGENSLDDYDPITSDSDSDTFNSDE